MKRSAFPALCLGFSVAFFTFANAQTPYLEPLWGLAPGSRSYLTTDNTQRGMAYNPVTGDVLLVNRAGGLSVNILDGETGADKGSLNVTGISGGTLAANMIGVADDGAVYLGNLTINGSTDPFRLYRWSDQTSAPALVYSGNPALGNGLGANSGLRFGDTFDVRGAGSSTQVLLPSRGTNFVSILTTGDGVNFTANFVQTDASGAAASNGPFGLGAAFGAGDTFWGKSSSGTPLREVDFNLGTGVGTTAQSIGDLPSTLWVLGVDRVNGLLAGIDMTTPDQVRLYDISDFAAVLDSELLPSDNANLNGTGAVDFGGGMLFVLDSNNGLAAFGVVPEPSTVALLITGAAALLFFRRRC
jgi:hypothetical protein